MLKDYLKEKQPVFYHIVTNELLHHQIPHAFLLNGKNVDQPLSFIKMSLICDQPIACETCIDCQKVMQHHYADIIEIDGSLETIKKAHIENIQSAFHKSAIEGKYKIYVIKQIENATQEAMNSLLKMLEEPVDGIYAIFTTQNINKVLPTIISRCQLIDIKPLQKDDIMQQLMEHDVEAENASILSAMFNDPDQILKLDMDNIQDIKIEVLNFIDDLFLHRENLIINTQLHLIKNHNNKTDIKIFLNMLILAFKDMFHVKHNSNIIFTNQVEKFKSYEYDNDELIKKIELVLETQNAIDYNANIPLLMDSMMYRI